MLNEKSCVVAATPLAAGELDISARLKPIIFKMYLMKTSRNQQTIHWVTGQDFDACP